METAVPRRNTPIRDALFGFVLAETILFAFAIATNGDPPWIALLGIPYALIFGFIQGTIVGIFHPIALLWPAYNVLAILMGGVLTAVLLNIDRAFIRVLGFAVFFLVYLLAFFLVVVRLLPSPIFMLTSPTPW